MTFKLTCKRKKGGFTINQYDEDHFIWNPNFLRSNFSAENFKLHRGHSFYCMKLPERSSRYTKLFFGCDRHDPDFYEQPRELTIRTVTSRSITISDETFPAPDPVTLSRAERSRQERQRQNDLFRNRGTRRDR